MQHFLEALIRCSSDDKVMIDFENTFFFFKEKNPTSNSKTYFIQKPLQFTIWETSVSDLLDLYIIAWAPEAPISHSSSTVYALQAYKKNNSCFPHLFRALWVLVRRILAWTCQKKEHSFLKKPYTRLLVSITFVSPAQQHIHILAAVLS